MRWFSSIILLLFILALAGCAQTTPPAESTPSPILTETFSDQAATERPSAQTSKEPSPESAAPLVPEYEVELVAKTLRGECYDDQPDDKREVVKVICNRVAVSGFGGSIEAVVTAKGQFYGYRPGNEPTANDYAVAREVLEQWYGNGCRQMSEYLFFSSGGGHKNIFRKEWKETS
jgi:hypothetical protein